MLVKFTGLRVDLIDDKHLVGLRVLTHKEIKTFSVGPVHTGDPAVMGLHFCLPLILCAGLRSAPGSLHVLYQAMNPVIIDMNGWSVESFYLLP